MERKKEDRSFLVYIGLSLVTCGIYGIIFMWNFIKDLNEVSSAKDPDGWKSPNYIVLVLLTAVTCGFYILYWIYKVGNTIQRAGEDYDVRIDENGTTLLLWTLLGGWVCGLGVFVTYHLMFKNMNKICCKYNEEFIDNGVCIQENSYQNNRSYENKPDNSQTAPRNIQAEPKDIMQTQGGLTIGMEHGVLVCTKGSMKGAEIAVLDNEMVTIGRDGAVSNLILPDRDISRRHCTVQFNAGENCYYVTDYSSFGTRMNGSIPLEKEVTTRCLRGTRIVLGQGNNEFLLQ